MGPVIAIVGSVDGRRSYDPPLRAVEEAAAAANQLGAQLAAQGCRIVVYSGASEFVEREVVRGYVGSGRAVERSVEIREMFRGSEDFPLFQERPELFDVVPEASDDWEVGFYRSLLTVDGVLLVGGGRATFAAGLIALSREIPLAPVATFGGSAEKLWQRLSVVPGLATRNEITAMIQPWSVGRAAEVVRALVAQHARRQEAERQAARERRLADRRGGVSLLVALLMIVGAVAMIPLAYAMATGTWQSVSVLLLAPVLASGSGAVIRNSLDGEDGWLRAGVQGAVAGTVAAVLFIAAQLSTNPETLAQEGARRLLFFIIAVGFVGGFTSELVYGKLRGQDVLRTAPLDRADGPPPGS